MAGRDNVLFMASVSSGTSAGSVIPLSFLYGIENVRQGYGTPVLKSVRAYYTGGIASGMGVPIEIKNSNWVDSAGVIAQQYSDLTALNKDSLSFMRGRDKELQPNTSWIMNATLPANTTSSMAIYVLVEIEYSNVAGISTENAAGSPIMKTCFNASVTGSSNVNVSLGTYDNLLQGVTYVLSEVSMVGNLTAPVFIVIEGFSNQKGLVRIIPVKGSGLADQIEGSVYLTKQTYNLGMISATSTSSAPITVNLEMIASSN